ncbi:MAG: gfo/Idh/MocA family oxidoreductase [Actinobacteria bacterium]|nr:gfo/Idh/MocA family oxidoreductase [Actinomycetota bacterium]
MRKNQTPQPLDSLGTPNRRGRSMNASKDAPPTVAIVGTGQIGAVHVECARRAGATVVGLVGSSPDRARAKATAWGVPVVYSGLEELLEQPDIDVVHIASPNHVHASQAIAVASAGKHVICEKPMALDSASAGAMVDAAQAAGVVHATCFNFRFYPLMHEAHAMMRSGELGEPRFLTGSYHQDWLFEDTDWNWRLDSERAGDLRSVADIGSHWLDLMSWISGRRVTEVCADLHTFIPVRYRPHGEVETFSCSRWARRCAALPHFRRRLPRSVRRGRHPGECRVGCVDRGSLLMHGSCGGVNFCWRTLL